MTKHLNTTMNTTTTATAPAFWARIYIAGDLAEARAICRRFCWDTSYCVTVTPTTYVYKGGQEEGVVVGLINYPRFPETPEQIRARAQEIGAALMEGLNQTSFSIEDPELTNWFSRRAAA